MLSDEIIDKVTERLTNRIEQINTSIIKKMGESINRIGTLSPTEARKLAQIMKYGGDYEKIVKELAKITNLNAKDIKDIFEETAKSDYRFAKQFYDYRNIGYIPYEENQILKNQVQVYTNVAVNNYITQTKAIGFTMTDLKGRKTFKSLGEAYNELIDRAVLSISQGKSTFQEELHKTIKEIAGGGLKTLDYSTGRTMRLDSAIRMNIKDDLREMHNENQRLFGQQFDADGVEITVHLNPAEDHADAQGKQFSYEEFEKLQETGSATTYDGKQVDMHLILKSGEIAEGFRPISQYNCYHYTFAIILGISEQSYTNQELNQIKKDNRKGFDFEGKHYTNYEGTQLQREIERKIREQKDIQIMAKASGDDRLVGECQHKITMLTRKYNELNQASGLLPKAQRLRVAGYKRMAIKK